MVKDTTLYDILEINSNATETEIKKSYNKLSKIWHPDRHIDEQKKEEAHLKFQKINQAKDILLDTEKRKLYDQIGMDIFNNGNNDDDFNPFEHFSNVFGGGLPFGNGFPFGSGSPFNKPESKNENENIVEQLEATLEQIVNKESINLNYKQKSSCASCNGNGTKDGNNSICNKCNGKGVYMQVIQMGPMVQQVLSNCSFCNGSGVYIDNKNKCNTCSGNGYIIKNKSVMVPLIPDVLFGKDVIFEGKGHNIKNKKSNLVVKIIELPHNVFTRYNDDLFMTMDLKLYQSLFGFNKIIKHLDGRILHISCSNKTNFNSIKKINNEGIMNINGKKGDLYIKFNISLPNISLSSNEIKKQLNLLLQSFEKQEVYNESVINKKNNLTKTICNDVDNQLSEQILFIMDKLKKNKNHTRNNVVVDSDDSENVQCVQQ